ncbi:hypothetical protein GS480_15785 [Rhodococcus hoagii]|nr:hypothetical protein [Prescottella equi]
MRLAQFLPRLSAIQRIEDARGDTDAAYTRRIRISIVSVRDAPAHEPAVMTLKN